MKLRLLLLSLSLGTVLPAFSQIDVTQLTADTKTFIFDDDKNTVKSYIYDELEAKTSCCGAARIYLEVKIAPSGYVLSAKTLTGKNDCYKKSAIDIVKNIKWNAAGFQGPKSVYFEIKPEVDCGDRANAYEALPIFNNGELDVNGVPVNYANSTGVSALNASGGAPTGVPNPTTDPALATSEPTEGETSVGNEPENTNAGETETANEVAENNPPANTPPESTGADAGEAEKTSEPIAEANTPKPPTTTPAKDELEKARQAAALREDREKQASEIEKLKAELEAVKKQEEDRKAREAEQARLAAAEKERQEMEDARQRREEQDRERRAAQRESENRDRYADNSRNDRDRYDNNRDSRSGGYDDQYADNRRNDDGYGDTDPPRQMSEAQRKEEEKRKLDDELRDIQNRMREMDNQARRNEADRRRAQQDLARIQEKALLKGEEIQQAREREELEKLKLQRTEAEQKKREQEELLRRVMDEIKRMQLDMERKMADMERLEKELTDRQTQEQTYGQQVTKNQEMRKAEIERQIDAIKMQAGIASGGSTTAPISGGAPSVPINISANDSNAISILAQQIAQLRNEISNLQNYVVNSQGGGSFATNAGNRTRSATPRPTTTSGTNANKSNSWKKIDYRNPEDKKADIYNSFGSSEGVKKAKEHKNMTIGKMAEPKFAGNTEAMKKEVAQKLQAGGICGLVQTTFIVTVAPNGEVVGYDITFANTPAVQLQLGGILKNLKFQSTPTTRMNSRALYELKAEIVCEGEERINIKDVPDLINQ